MTGRIVVMHIIMNIYSIYNTIPNFEMLGRDEEPRVCYLLMAITFNTKLVLFYLFSYSCNKSLFE